MTAAPARRSRAAVAALGTVLVALVLAVAVPSSAAPARPAGRDFPPQRPTRVLVLGDSVMKGAESRYGADLPGREVVVDAVVSRSTGASADALEKLGTDWDVVVILLAHNDGGTPGAYQPAARRILDQLRGVPWVSWLTIHEVRPYYPDVNRFVFGLQAEYPNLHVADWNAVANAHPEGLAGDGLHLNGTGAALMSGLVAEQVMSAEFGWYLALRRLAAPTTTTTTAPPTTTTTTAPATTTTTRATTTEAPTTSSSVARRADDGASDEGGRAANSAPIALGAVVVLAAAGGTWALVRRRRRAG